MSKVVKNGIEYAEGFDPEALSATLKNKLIIVKYAATISQGGGTHTQDITNALISAGATSTASCMFIGSMVYNSILNKYSNKYKTYPTISYSGSTVTSTTCNEGSSSATLNVTLAFIQL